MIGDVRVDVARFASRPNVLFLGPRPIEALPAYAQHWSVSIYPVRDSPQIRAGNPLKLREYLAVGRPIVTPVFPAMEPYRHLLELCDYGTDFSDAILKAAADHDRDGQRRARVASESWEARASDVDRLLRTLEVTANRAFSDALCPSHTLPDAAAL